MHGNVDEPELRALLPPMAVAGVGDVRIGLVHDAGRRKGRAERLVQRFPACDAVVYGHSHLPEVELHRGVWILNPGSPTARRRAPAHTMISLQVVGAVLEPRLLALDP